MKVINSNGMQINKDALNSAKKDSYSPPLQTENTIPAEPAHIDASVLKAYAGISDTKTISKEELFDHLRQIGIKNEKRFDDILTALTDNSGQIPASAFEFLKRYEQKNTLIWDSLRIFEEAKNPEGNFNYKALQLADAIMSVKDKNFYYHSYDYCPEVLRRVKNQDGSFNNAAMAFFTKHADHFKKLFEYDTKHVFAILQNKNGKFDTTALNYADEKLSQGEKTQEIFSQILDAKDKNGNFSFYVKNLTDELNSVFDRFKAAQVKKIALSFDEDKNIKRDEFIELAKSMKDDENFTQIFNFIEKSKNEENNNYGFEFDKPTVEFVKKLVTSTYDGENKTKIALQKLGKPYSSLSQKDTDILKRLFIGIDTKNIEMFVDASIKKAGENKGNFDASALENYLDIYSKNYNVTALPDIEYMAKCFELEEDNYALDTFTKLYNMRWEAQNKSLYAQEERLDRNILHFVLRLSCLEKEGHPTRPCLKQVLDNLNKMMTMKLPMSSKEAFENFIIYQDMDTIEKIEKINFQELGIKKTGQISAGIFKTATEEELLHFKEYLKDYLKDKKVDYVDINLNKNISSIVELTTGGSWEKTKLLYDIKKGEPTTEIKEKKWINFVERQEHDFKNNTITSVRHKIEQKDYSDYEIFKSMSTKKFDKDNNLIYEEVIEPSTINGIFNITKTYADGKVEKISNALTTKEGNDIVEKNMESLDGTKTYYRYEDDPKGNRILDYKITDKNGKKLLDSSVTFEVIDDNHFVSSRNNKKFDIKFDEKSIRIENLQNGKIAQIDLKNFTKDTADLLLPVLKAFPGDELFNMKELDLKAFYVLDSLANAAFSPKEQAIITSREYIDIAVLLHEWGHAKDDLMFKEIAEKIKDDKTLREIYNEEKNAFREHFCDAQLSEIGYFTADYHYLGSDSIKEGIAETNSILNTCPKNKTQGIRSHFWMQYFPRTIAYLAGILE